jgi:hypothetical protein
MEGGALILQAPAGAIEMARWRTGGERRFGDMVERSPLCENSVLDDD